MIWQAQFTIPVIDRPMGFPQLAEMLTHDEIRDELIRQLDQGRFTAASVARRLSIAPARVTEMRKGERRVQQSEMPILAEMLGLTGPPAGNPVESVSLIPLLGRVAQGVWMEQTADEPEEFGNYILDSRNGLG